MNASFPEPGAAGPAGAATPGAESSGADRLWSVLGLDDAPPRTATCGLALPSLTVHDANDSMRYAVAAVDVWGRVADRSLLRSLGWGPGQTISVAVRRGATIVVRPSRRGRLHVTRQGHLRVPASVRHLVHLAGGDQLLLAASPERDLLVAYPAHVLDAMLVNYHLTCGAR